MACRFKLRWVSSKTKTEGEWQLSTNLRNVSFWLPSSPDELTGFDLLGINLPESDWKRGPNSLTYKHGRVCLTDILKALEGAGIPGYDILVKPPIPPELERIV